jgi:hypothetical protein
VDTPIAIFYENFLDRWCRREDSAPIGVRARLRKATLIILLFPWFSDISHNMILQKDQMIAGYAASVIRRLLRKMGSAHIAQEFVEKNLGCSPKEAARLISCLERAGYLAARGDGNNRHLYRKTTQGNRLAEASLRPISRTTAHRVLQGFVQRVRKVNSNRSFLFTITAAVVFGSAASDAEELGDVDVAVRLERKVDDWETHVRLSYDRVWEARRRGKQFRNITEQVFWPAIEIRNFLKSGTRQLNIHEFDELSRLPELRCRILFGESHALAKLLPNATIIP